MHMDPLERTSQIITLTEVINDILVSRSPSRRKTEGVTRDIGSRRS
ncbi:hypothetical protein ACLB1M_05515 [Escherichia coli]